MEREGLCAQTGSGVVGPDSMTSRMLGTSSVLQMAIVIEREDVPTRK